MRPLLPPITLLASLHASACCGLCSKDQPPPPEPISNAAADQPVVLPSQPEAPNLPSAFVEAPPSKSGAPRRGIVRAGPDFKAREMTRLDNGTKLWILQRGHGGWLQVKWESGGPGWIHRDVVRQ